jgi:hypothetical protein
MEVRFNTKRQQYLVEQGYAYHSEAPDAKVPMGDSAFSSRPLCLVRNREWSDL